MSRWPQVGLQGRDPGVWVALGGLQWLKAPRHLGAGNEALHALTAAGPTELRVDLRTPLDAAFAHYRDFAIAGPEEHYRLHLGAYSGTAGAGGSWPMKGPRVLGGYWGVPWGIGRALGEGCWPMGRVLGSPVGVLGGALAHGGSLQKVLEESFSPWVSLGEVLGGGGWGP